MQKILHLFLIAFPTFLLIDLLWLGVIAKNFYRKEFGHLMMDSPNWTAAIIFYVLFIFGLIIFVIEPSLNKEIKKFLPYAAFFGLVTYATFDLTSLALLKNWPLKASIVDLVWGAIIASLVTTITISIYNKFL